jgi:hypothetical protein
MSKIDLSHNSAPLQGAMRPSLEEVNALLRQDALVVWDCPERTSADIADRKFFLFKITSLAAVFVMGLIGYFFLNGSPRSAQRPATSHEQTVTNPGRVVPLSSVKHSLYLVLRRPSAEFIAYLAQLASKGVTVRMVTAMSLPSGTGISASTVRADQISADGVLIDGTSWYAIEADSRLQ